MRVALRFDIEIDDKGMEAYFASYLSFAESDGEEPIDVLIREAIAQWDFDGLIKEARGVALAPEHVSP